jgi:shikimate dehydrogenase
MADYLLDTNHTSPLVTIGHPLRDKILESRVDEMLQRKLALIGTGIGRSSAPRLHRLAGELSGLSLTYDLIDLAGQDPAGFEATLAGCAAQGYWGVNVTYPFKEQAAQAVAISSPLVRQIGAVNTVLFAGRQPGQGYNTDYAGFLRAYQKRFPTQPPGIVAVVGSGGVGRAVAFGLAQLGAQALRLVDVAGAKAEQLAAALAQAMPQVKVQTCQTLAEATAGADGLVNCTPIGMWQHPGSPIPAGYIDRQQWAFDVIYTPTETEFLATARARGLAVLAGYELFFYQGVAAYEYFTGQQVDEARLRLALATA